MNRAASENPLGLGLVIIGAVVMAISAFLPLDEPTGALRMVSENTLIQQHSGWILIGAAVAIAYSGYRASHGRRTKWLAPPILLCALAALIIVRIANDKDIRTLYPVRPDGTVDTSHPGEVVSLGVSIYVAGAGVAVALIGSLILLQSAKSGAADASNAPAPAKAATKKCPDCAETVLADAKVCKHCGYPFPLPRGAVAPAQQVVATGPSSFVRCFKCNHRQEVPLSLLTFHCAQCNTTLKRSK